MSASSSVQTPAPPAWLSERDCDLDAFRALVEQPTDASSYPLASAVERNVLLYDAERLALADRRTAQAELVRALADGPGIVVIRGAFPDTSVVDRTTAVFDALIAQQRASGAAMPATTSRSRGPTTGCGTPWRRPRCTTRRCSPTTTPTTSSPWCRRPGWAPATR